MGRILVLLYGAVCYVISFITLLYSIGFIGNLVVPKSIDSGIAGSLGPAALVNVLLLGIFAIQHSVMARPVFKAWWSNFVPAAIERSTYVLLTSLALILLFWLWQPIGGHAWSVKGVVARNLLWALFWSRWAIVLPPHFRLTTFTSSVCGRSTCT